MLACANNVSCMADGRFPKAQTLHAVCPLCVIFGTWLNPLRSPLRSQRTWASESLRRACSLQRRDCAASTAASASLSRASAAAAACAAAAVAASSSARSPCA